MKIFALVFYTLIFGVLGVSHFVMPAFFVNMMPPFLPAPEALNKVAGIAELMIAGVLWTPYRKGAIYMAMVMLGIFLVVIHGWHIWIGKFPSVPAMGVPMLWGRAIAQLFLLYGLWWLRDK